MTKTVKVSEPTIDYDDNVAIDEAIEEEFPRERPKRSKVYQRSSEIEIPSEVTNFFKKRGYAVRFIRWSEQGNPDYRYLGRREREGYEFVTSKDLPPDLLRTFQTVNINNAQGLITNGSDLCLMKIDEELRQSREDFYVDATNKEVNAANSLVTKKIPFYSGRSIMERNQAAKQNSGRNVAFRGDE